MQVANSKGPGKLSESSWIFRQNCCKLTGVSVFYLPWFFYSQKNIFDIWEKIKCSHQKTANIFSWNQNFVELFLKIGDFPKICDRRSFYDHSQNIWSTITHNHDRQKVEKYDLRSLMIVIWSEMIGDHDPISPISDSK